MAKPTLEEELSQLKTQVRAWREDAGKFEVKVMFMESALEVLAEAFRSHLPEASRQTLTEHLEESFEAAYRMLDARFGAESPLFEVADEQTEEIREWVVNGKAPEPSID